MTGENGQSHELCEDDDDNVQLPFMSLAPATQRSLQTMCLVVLAVLAGTYLIYWLRPVLVPFVVALFVVSGLSPILAVLERTLGVTRIVAAAITFLAGFALLIIFGSTIVFSVADLGKNSDKYIQRVDDIVREVDARFPLNLQLKRNPNGLVEPEERQGDSAAQDDQASPAGKAEQALAEVESIAPETSKLATRPLAPSEQGPSAPGIGTVPAETGATKTPMGESSRQTEVNSVSATVPSSSKPDLLESLARQGIAIVSQSLLNLISTSVVVLIFVFFLLLGTPSIVASSPTIHEINHQVRSYLALKTIISVLTGLAFGLALRLFGVPMAFTFGVLAFLLNFVPNVGPIVASLLPIPLIIFDPSGNLWWMVAAITVTSMIQVISGNIFEPKIMGESSDLHPVVVLLSLMFWGMMWGVIGMFLATPIAAGFKIVLERFDETRPIAAFMAGRSVNEAKLES